MLERVIGDLLNRYVFEDGIIKSVGLFRAVGNVTLFVSAPMLPGHPEYAHARMVRNLRAGRIYSQEDWRNLEICFSYVEDCRAQLGSEPLAVDHLHKMPYELEIDCLELKLISSVMASSALEAEALNMSFRFHALRYSDSLMNER